jgi:hypothetical protein
MSRELVPRKLAAISYHLSVKAQAGDSGPASTQEPLKADS